MLGNARATDLINGGRAAEVLAVIEMLDSGAERRKAESSRRARDPQLLDAVDAFREPLDAEV